MSADRFGHIRAILHDAPADRHSWRALCRLLSHVTQPHEVEHLRVYVEHHAARWPSFWRTVPDDWKRALCNNQPAPWVGICRAIQTKGINTTDALKALFQGGQLKHIEHLHIEKPAQLGAAKLNTAYFDDSHTPLKSFSCMTMHMSTALFKELFHAPAFAQVEALNVQHFPIFNRAPAAWYGVPMQKTLKHIGIYDGPSGMHSLFNSKLPALKSLYCKTGIDNYDYSHSRITGPIESSFLPQLERLQIPFLDERKIREILKLTPHVTHLDLSHTEHAVRPHSSDLIPQEIQQQLVALDLYRGLQNCNVYEPFIEHLEVPKIQTLSIGYNRMRSKALRQLFQKEWFGQIKKLDLSGLTIPHITIKALIDSGIRPEALDLTQCSIKPKSWDYLIDSGFFNHLRTLVLSLSGKEETYLWRILHESHTQKLSEAILNEKYRSTRVIDLLDQRGVYTRWSREIRRLWRRMNPVYCPNDTELFSTPTILFGSLYV